MNDGTVWVRHHRGGWCQAAQQGLGRTAVRGLVADQQERERTALAVAQGVDLGGAPVAADAEDLGTDPLATRRTPVCLDVGAVGQNLGLSSASNGQNSNSSCQTPLVEQRTKRS